MDSMSVIQQTLSVPQDKQLHIQLPDDFTSPEINISIRPSSDIEIEERRRAAMNQVLDWDISAFSAEQLTAYQRIIRYIRDDYHPNTPPPFGLYDGLVWMSDDFDAPMDDEALWYSAL